MFDFIRRFMSGRYGNDALGRFLMICALVIALIWNFIRLPLLAYVLIVLLGIYYYRFFSKDVGRRQAENQRFSGWWLARKRAAGEARLRFEDRKEHRYYRCKGCRTYLRVPRNKGKINIQCPKCGSEFVKKT